MVFDGSVGTLKDVDQSRAGGDSVTFSIVFSELLVSATCGESEAVNDAMLYVNSEERCVQGVVAW